MDWRVDIKGASDQMSQMNVPTVLVELKVRDDHRHRHTLTRHTCTHPTLTA